MKRRTYADFKHSGCGNTFAEYMGINAPTFYWDYSRGGWVMQRFDHIGGTVKSECKPTKKEAKASYKEALARHREDVKATKRAMESDYDLAN